MRRHFQIWEYTVSHGQLLLRSNRDADHATRVDILFKDVTYLSLPPSLDLVGIDELDDGEVRRLLGAPADSALEYGHTGFGLQLETGRALVVAGSMFTAEDEGAYHEPSSLPVWPMRSGEPTEAV